MLAFKTEPITMDECLQVLIVSALVVLMVEIDKWKKKNREHNIFEKFKNSKGY